MQIYDNGNSVCHSNNVELFILPSLFLSQWIGSPSTRRSGPPMMVYLQGAAKTPRTELNNTHLIHAFEFRQTMFV